MSVLEINKKKNNQRQMFLDGPVGIARYDVLRYPNLDALTKKQRSFFWQPEEINGLNKDKDEFQRLPLQEQNILKKTISRQTLLDSVQGRAPAEAFSPICSVPELEIWLQTWTFFETIHSYSYTYIIRNVYPDPSKVFDEIMNIKEIADCAKDISQHYDDLIRYNAYMEIGWPNYNLHEHKKRLWLALMTVNLLESIRFYASFACTFAFAERRLMEGTAKILKLISKDEALHAASTQYILKQLRKDDEEFEQIARETEQESVFVFESAIEQEKKWAKYLFEDGSMIGLTEQILCQYIDFIAKQRMKIIDLPNKIEINQNPLPWMNKWLSSREVQVANQEVNGTSYTVGSTKQDITKNSFKGFKL